MGAKSIREMICMFKKKTYQIKMLTFIYNKISLINGIFTTNLEMVKKDLWKQIFIKHTFLISRAVSRICALGSF